MRIPILPLLVFLGAALFGPPLPAEDLPPLLPMAVPDPFRLGSLPFESSLAAVPEEGEWAFSAGWSWFNFWNIEWQTAAIHREWGLGPEDSLTGEELRELEARYPGEDHFHVDLEGNLIELIAARGLGRGTALAIRIPWLSMGGPHWDAIPDEWHELFNLPTANREDFPRGDSILYLSGDSGTIESRDFDESGLGDISLALTFSAAQWFGADHRFVLTVEAPTGDEDNLHGSGGWDAGVRWHAIWTFSRSRLATGAGWNFLSSSGSFLGMERTDTWWTEVGYDHLLGQRFAFNLGASYQSSPLADSFSSDPGEPALVQILGLSTRLGSASWLSLQYLADRRGVGVSPDTSFRLLFTRHFRRGPDT